jgi:hypothetical protein
VDCVVETVASAATRLGVGRIDLLKVDTERGELGVLLGIGTDLWPGIHNVAVEAEDHGGTVDTIGDLLTRQGMTVSVTQLPGNRGTGLHMLYARR